MKMVFGLILCALALIACSDSSSSGGGGGLPGLRQENLDGEKEITADEYAKATSSWYTGNCSGFESQLEGKVFRRETRVVMPQVSMHSLTTERVTTATADQVVLEQTYDFVNIPGISGGIYVDNRSQRVCHFSNSGNGTSMNCDTVGKLTPEAENYVRNMPEDPDKDCQFKETVSWDLKKFYSGTFVFDDGQKVPAFRSQYVVKNTYDCKGQIETRTVSFMEAKSNAVKAYPGESTCGTTLHEKYLTTKADGRVTFNVENRAVVYPKK